MKITTIILLAAALIAPVFLSSCATNAGTAVAGAATYKAVDDHREDERREDYVKAKTIQKNRR